MLLSYRTQFVCGFNIRWFWLLVAVLLGCTPSQAQPELNQQAMGAQPEAQHAKYIDAARLLIDDGDLSDRRKLEQLLKTRFVTIRQYDHREPANVCEEHPAADRLMQYRSYKASTAFWLRSSATQSNVEYRVTKTFPCLDPISSPPIVSAEIFFYQGDSPTCILEKDFEKDFPQAKFSPATDFAWIYHYDGVQKDTWATFSFKFSTRCLLGFNIEQSPRVQMIRSEREQEARQNAK